MRFDDDAMQRRVLVRAKDCPTEEVTDALRDASIRFCSETYCLTNGAEVVTEGESDTPLDIDMTDFVVLDVVNAEIDGETVDIVPANDERVKEATDALPVIVYGGDVSSMVLVPTPSAPVTIQLQLAVTLGPEAEELPDVVWQRHYRALCDGAIALLREQPDRPWSNAKDALMHEGRFVFAINAAAAFYGMNRLNLSRRKRSEPV